MSKLTLATVLDQVRQLPPLPALVLELLHSFGNEDIAIEELARKISQDQALVARALRVANSPYYGLQGKIGTIEEAIVVLGFHTVRMLVTAAGVIGRFPGPVQRWFDHQGFWQHSLGVALCAKSLAKATSENQEGAFTSGLLHDIGRLVLVTYFPEQYREVVECRRQHDMDLLEAEHALLGLDHAAVGAALMERWKLPLAIKQAVANHHDPDDVGGSLLVDLVHVANVMCHALDIGNSDDDVVPFLSGTAWSRLGIGWPEFKSFLAEVEKQYAGTSTLIAG